MIKLINKLKNKKGFTLIELIVVLAVLGVIMAIAVPRFVGVQEQAAKDADKASLALIAKTAELYYVQGITSEGAVEAKLQEDFPNGIEFKSEDGKGLSDVKIDFDDDGVATVNVDDTSLSYTNN